jgi:Ca2+-binding RTX toxin-like protein
VPVGNDILDGGNGDDTLNGGGGTDTVLQAADADQTLTNTRLIGQGTDTLSSIEAAHLTGGASTNVLDAAAFTGNVTLEGLGGDDQLLGGSGDDILLGGDGNDTLTTSPGVDTLDAGDGDDMLVVQGTHAAGDSLTGGAGYNTFRFMPGTMGNLELSSLGQDTLDFAAYALPVSIDLGLTSPQDVGGGLLLTLRGFFQRVIGTLFDDILIGNDADNELVGLDGDDLLDGAAGADLLDGGSGIDSVNGYQAGDAHISIEIGLPAGAPPGNPMPGSASQAPTVVVQTASNGQTVDLSCEAPVTRLRLPEGLGADFHELCGYQAKLTSLEDHPYDDVLDGVVLWVTLFRAGRPVDIVPEGAYLRLYAEATPAGTTQGTYVTRDVHPASAGIAVGPTLLYWDPILNQGEGAWIQLPSDPQDTGAAWESRLHPESPSDGRLVYQGVVFNHRGGLEVTLNFTGLFAIGQLY